MNNRFPLRRISIALVVASAAAQLVRPERSNPPVGVQVGAPAEVRAVLERACWDCHSNETRWPWYSNVAPASWLLARHVRRGRQQINFSEWPLSAWDQQLNRELVWKLVRQGKMPLRSYLLLHPDARLSEEDRALIKAWGEESPILEFDPLTVPDRW